MKITLPRYLKSNFDGYSNFIELLRLLNDNSDLQSSISFERTEIFEANLSAILGAIIDNAIENQKTIEYSNIRSSIKDTFELNNFLRSTIPNLNPHQKGTIISFMKFTPYKDIEFMDYVKNEMLSKPNFPRHSKLLGKKINESIFELFENARTHGQCKYIYTCGQIIDDPDVTRLDFTIVDMGKTIKSNVNLYLNTNYSGCDAIEWAMQSGHTTKTGEVSGGLGLDIIFEFIKLNKGRIQIVSSDGYFEYFENRIEKKTFKDPFHGTIANIEFNLNDKASYLLKEEISLDDIF
jgi:hypothetical protein